MHCRKLLEHLIQTNVSPKCKGKIALYEEILPYNTYELYCLMCGNRIFSTELVVVANMLFKLRKSKLS